MLKYFSVALPLKHLNFGGLLFYVIYITNFLDNQKYLQTVKAERNFVFPSEIDASINKSIDDHYLYYDSNSSSIFEEIGNHQPNNLYVDKKKASPNITTLFPLGLVRYLNHNSLDNFLRNYVVDEAQHEGIILQGRFGGFAGTQRDASVTLEPAKCAPEKKTITIATSNDPTIMYIPECVRIERCDGCCFHSLLSCRPQKVETVNVKVMKLQYTGGDKAKSIGYEIVPIERHITCACDCKLTANDCTSGIQQYNEDTCSCTCKNKDKEYKCQNSRQPNGNNNVERLWNPEVCSCQCRRSDLLPCPAGQVFSANRCQCRPAKGQRRRLANSTRRHQQRIGSEP